MSIFSVDIDDLVADVDEARKKGQEYSSDYQNAYPYPHICIDDFLPLDVVQRVRADALDLGEKQPEHASKQEHLKTSFKPEKLPFYSRTALMALNSPAFLGFLEEMTGIVGLIPDPYFFGGGIHRTNNGGFLGIHADFNQHPEMFLERRLNVLIYLNPDWKAEYGGAFEIWTKDMKERVAAFEPLLNRMCCFSTTSDSYHGNPEPVDHPKGDPRLSIAMYYYTATWSDAKVQHSTLFKPRPGSTDEKAVREHRRRYAKMLLPPLAYKYLERPLKKIGF